MARRPFTLYWSSLDAYEKCPQKFLWSRGWGNLDVGGGPGRKKPLPVKKSEHHALMGDAIQGVLELFYNEYRWKFPRELRSWLEAETEKQFKLALSQRYVDWRVSDMSREDMYRIVSNGVRGYLRTFKKHKLIGPYAQSEVNYKGVLKTRSKAGNPYQIPVGGRLDFVIRRDTDPGKGIMILDGKNGREYWDRNHPKRYTNPDQLRWYALCFFLFHKVMPDKLGFVYFRYPEGYDWSEEVKKYGEEAEDMGVQEETRAIKRKALAHYEAKAPASGVTWVPFTMEDLKGLAHRAKSARQGMDREEFAARPAPSNCGLCDYESVCPARQAQKEENRNKKAPGVLAALPSKNGRKLFTLGKGGRAVAVKG
jgi:hypothetical protein